VSADVWLPLLLAAVGVPYTLLTLRFARDVRQGDEEWRRRFRELDPARRGAITQAMRGGRAVQDPEDAELLLRGVAQVEYVLRAMRPLSIVGAVAVVALLVAGVLANRSFLVWIAAAGLAAALVSAPLAWWRRKRYLQSAAATRRLQSG
jgi:hypothetical protein